MVSVYMDDVFTGTGATVNLALNQAIGIDGAVSQLIGIEDVEGSYRDDTIIGNSTGNALFGDTGSDTISGGGGNDLANGGAGADMLSRAAMASTTCRSAMIRLLPRP
jgi:Ca2+-binding RTX toxin-like protein